MVEYTYNLDTIFYALSDATRRSVLDLLSKAELTIGEIAENFTLTYAAISKHIKVLESAHLVNKRRDGKHQVVAIVPDALDVAKEHIERYAQIWSDRFDTLEEFLKS